MDNNLHNQELYQLVIDEVNRCLNKWKNSNNFNRYPTHSEVQSMFLSKLKNILVRHDYSLWNSLRYNGAPICFIDNYRVKNIMCNDDHSQKIFSRCDYFKDIPDYIQQVESIYSVTFNKIQQIKFS